MSAHPRAASAVARQMSARLVEDAAVNAARNTSTEPRLAFLSDSDLDAICGARARTAGAADVGAPDVDGEAAAASARCARSTSAAS